jgi:hypothetical protein
MGGVNRTTATAAINMPSNNKIKDLLVRTLASTLWHSTARTML